MARQQRDDGINGVLGAWGVELYNMARHKDYQSMVRYSTAWRLSEEDRRYVYTAMTTYRQAGHDAAARESLARETEASLRRYLGDDRYELLKRASIIKW